MNEMMIPMVIPAKQLKELGFIELKENLFIKALGDGIRIYRDYRNIYPTTYAYKFQDKIDHKQFKETRAIEKIEKSVGVEATGFNKFDNQVTA